MLDGVSFNRLNPNSRSADLGGLNQDQYNQQTNSFEAIPDEKLFMVLRSAATLTSTIATLNIDHCVWCVGVAHDSRVQLQCQEVGRV